MATTINLTTSTKWVVPSNWNSSNNSVTCTGTATFNGSGSASNVVLTPGATITYSVGTGDITLVYTPSNATATYTFTDATVTNFPVPSDMVAAQVLVVAGGGSGAPFGGGGGGGGGVLMHTSYSPTPLTNLTVTIGAGGAAVTSSGSHPGGNAGSNSVFGPMTALGGGPGRDQATTISGNGGSGGGAGDAVGAGGSATQGNSGGATGYGSAGGSAPGTANPGAGGGGAGGAGTAAPSSGEVGVAGGAGIQWPFNSTFYAGGGGSGGLAGNNGAGGSGGGGAGGTTNGIAGSANTGGGGGSTRSDGTSGAGGSGIIIVTYTVGNPFFQTEHPIPRGPARASDLRTFTNAIENNLIGKDQFMRAPGMGPSNWDWPVPKGPARLSSLGRIEQNNTLALIVTNLRTVNNKYDWPNPRGYVPGISLRTHIDPLKLLLLNKDQFFTTPGKAPIYDYPNPRGYTYPNSIRGAFLKAILTSRFPYNYGLILG